MVLRIITSSFKLRSPQVTQAFYNSEWYMEGELFDASKNTNINVKLVPIGKTVLRRVTFPKYKTHEK